MTALGAPTVAAVPRIGIGLTPSDVPGGTGGPGEVRTTDGQRLPIQPFVETAPPAPTGWRAPATLPRGTPWRRP
jgi:hypothetical protein